MTIPNFEEMPLLDPTYISKLLESNGKFWDFRSRLHRIQDIENKLKEAVFTEKQININRTPQPVSNLGPQSELEKAPKVTN